MGMWAVLLLFDHALGLRRSCSEEWFWRGGGGVLALILGVPCSPLSRLISSRRRWISAWAARRSALTSSSRLRSEEHTSELQSQSNLVCRLLLEKKKHDNGSDSLYWISLILDLARNEGFLPHPHNPPAYSRNIQSHCHCPSDHVLLLPLPAAFPH